MADGCKDVFSSHPPASVDDMITTQIAGIDSGERCSGCDGAVKIAAVRDDGTLVLECACSSVAALA